MGSFRPWGPTTRVAYDPHGLPVRIERAVGTSDQAVVTLGREDPAHPSDVTSVTDPLGAVTSYTYDDHGDVVTRVDALGTVVTATRDDLGELLSMTDPLGAVVTFTSDARGLPVAITDPLGGTTSLARDAIGRPRSVTNALGDTAILARDPTGRTTSVTLPDGTILASAYDATGASVRQTDGDAAVWQIPRDDQGRQVGWVDPLGNGWRLDHDAVGRLSVSTDPVGNETTYEWDAAGQLTSIDRAGDSPDVTFSYDLDGRRVSMTDGLGTTSYSWDALGRLVAVTDGAGRTVATTYDAGGSLTSITYPDGRVVERDHDVLGRLVEIRDGLGHTSRFKWDPAGRLVRTIQGDGSITDQSRGPRGDVTGITVTVAEGDGPILDLRYQRDAMGRVIAITDALASTVAPVTRDARGRLMRVGGETFAFDGAGALTSLRGSSLEHDPAGRLVSATGETAGRVTFTNDSAGRRSASTPTHGDPIAYRWDAAGRLVEAAGTHYGYDGDGLRTSMASADGAVAAFAWLRSGGLPVLLTDGTSAWVHGPDGLPLEEIRADGSVRWLHADQGGSIRAVTDQDGHVVATAEWDAYGALTRSTGEPIGRLGFQGHYTDAVTGLQYLIARYYDPSTGAFLSMDPRVQSTRQPFAFASGDPLTHSDPSGTDALGDAMAAFYASLYPEGYTAPPMDPEAQAAWTGLGKVLGSVLSDMRTSSQMVLTGYGANGVAPGATCVAPASVDPGTTPPLDAAIGGFNAGLYPEDYTPLPMTPEGQATWSGLGEVMGSILSQIRSPFMPSPGLTW